MSVEVDVRAAMVGDAALRKSFGSRVWINAADQDAPPPFVVYSVTHAPVYDVTGVQMMDVCSVEINVWAATAAESMELADKVQAAVLAAGRRQGAQITARSAIDEVNLGLEATSLTITWTDY